MKHFVSCFFAFCTLLMISPGSTAQGKLFKRVVTGASIAQAQIRSITQDKQGYIWFGVRNNAGGLFRYDGAEITSYRHDQRDPNSLADNSVSALTTDSSGFIWIGTNGKGVDCFDPETKTFKHFRHDPLDGNSLGNDTIYALLEDHAGNIWVGTFDGLNMLDRSSGKFTRYSIDEDNRATGKRLFIFNLFEDRQHNLWAATIGEGLVWLDRNSGKLHQYKRQENNPQSIASDSVTSIFQDSRGNMWVGLAGDKMLQKLDVKTGTFTDYSTDPTQSGTPRPPAAFKGAALNYVSFIHEDATGNLWFGAASQGINRFDPATKQTTHYGVLYHSLENPDPVYDTLSGFSEIGNIPGICFQSKDGLLWIGCSTGNLYQVNPYNPIIPYNPVKNTIAVNSFFKDDRQNLWIALQEGLLYKPRNGPEKKYVHDPGNSNSLSNNIVNWLIPDEEGNLLLATYGGGLNIFNPRTQSFKRLRHDSANANSLSCDYATSLFIDPEKNLWITTDTGLNKLNIATGLFTRYLHDPKDSNTISNSMVYLVKPEKDVVWAGTVAGLNKLDLKTGKWELYLPLVRIQAMVRDAKGVLWVGTNRGVYTYSPETDNFNAYSYQNGTITIQNVLNIIEDHRQNLWITAAESILKLNPERDSLRIYGSENGVHGNDLLLVDNIITKDGELIFGDAYGYYAFYPEKIDSKLIPPDLYISGFQMGNKEIRPGKGSPIQTQISYAKEIRLKHDQNSFSFEFTTLHYAIPGDIKYLYKLENYDSTWQVSGTRNRAYFFNVHPGKYTLRVRAVATNGAIADRSIDIQISAPWYFTWWGILLQIIALALLVSLVSYLRLRQLRRQNKVLEEKVNHRTRQLNESLTNLKATQSQLIQSEKMASLGELTAGIAHEIQNPLNFVNNFSEVNKELIDELKQELTSGNQQEAMEIAENIRENEEKIIHHGKRADSIVKGMLQHSRASTGIKEPTDINALCDEYFRLAYHGLRAKDKSFNATMKMDFDPVLSSDSFGNGKIKIMQQDIGRVVLNLLTNAFYAVYQKQRELAIQKNIGDVSGSYIPTVTLSTNRIGDNVEIRVNDNGDGMPKEVLDKIFQPFFTTKPAGEGTGLGLSLSYEIITKSHSGQLRVVTRNDKDIFMNSNGVTSKISEDALAPGDRPGQAGTTFIITLPIK